MEINFINTNCVVHLHQQYTPRDRFLAIRKTASQGVSFAFTTFRLTHKNSLNSYFIGF
jgi:hypothetical protein